MPPASTSYPGVDCKSWLISSWPLSLAFGHWVLPAVPARSVAAGRKPWPCNGSWSDVLCQVVMRPIPATWHAPSPIFNPIAGDMPLWSIMDDLGKMPSESFSCHTLFSSGGLFQNTYTNPWHIFFPRCFFGQHSFPHTNLHQDGCFSMSKPGLSDFPIHRWSYFW